MKTSVPVVYLFGGFIHLRGKDISLQVIVRGVSGNSWLLIIVALRRKLQTGKIILLFTSRVKDGADSRSEAEHF